MRKKLSALPVRRALIVLFAGVMAFSLYQLWRTDRIYVQEAQIRRALEPFRPASGVRTPAEEEEAVNPTIVKLQDQYPDVAGWVRLDDTGVDYPFVQAPDNDYYLHRDLDGNYLFAGTAFLDHLSDPTFSSFSSVVYGHNMKNGTMFSDIGRYANAGFFNQNQSGWLFLPNATYRLDIFAFLTVQYNDGMIYKTDCATDREKQAMLDYIAQYAQRYRDLSLTPNDRLLILSTCTGDVKTMRNVLVARLVQLQ